MRSREDFNKAWVWLNKISKLVDKYIIAKHFRDIERMYKINKDIKKYSSEINKIYGRYEVERVGHGAKQGANTF